MQSNRIIVRCEGSKMYATSNNILFFSLQNKNLILDLKLALLNQ